MFEFLSQGALKCSLLNVNKNSGYRKGFEYDCISNLSAALTMCIDRILLELDTGRLETKILQVIDYP